VPVHFRRLGGLRTIEVAETRPRAVRLVDDAVTLEGGVCLPPSGFALTAVAVRVAAVTVAQGRDVGRRRRAALREGTVLALRPRLTIALEVAESLDEFSVGEVGSKVARSRIISGLRAANAATHNILAFAAVAVGAVTGAVTAATDLLVAHAVLAANAMDVRPRSPVARNRFAQRRAHVFAHLAFERAPILIVLNVARPMRKLATFGDVNDPPTLLKLRFPARRAHLIAVLPHIARDVRDRIDAVEHRMHVGEPTHTVVLQRRNVLKPLKTQVFDLRIERRAGLLVRRPLAFGPRHDEVIERFFRAALRGGRLHFERRRFEARKVRAPDRKRRRMIAFVLGSFAHDIVDRRAKTRRADHPAATAIRDHAVRSSCAIARITRAISARGSATVALISRSPAERGA